MSKAHLKGQTNMLIKPMNSSYLSINVLHTTEWIDLFGLIKVIDPATFHRTNFLRESATFSLGLILIYFPSVLQVVMNLVRDKKMLNYKLVDSLT